MGAAANGDSPTAYIPPITAHLITLFVSALGLAFIVLYRRKDTWKNRQESGRPEQILTQLKENPGHSLQQIADSFGMHRSTLRHYLCRMQTKNMISTTDYLGRSYYFAVEKSSTDIENLLYIILSQKKEGLVITVIREHPSITKRELTGKLRIGLTAGNWYLRRFLDEGLLMIVFDGVHNHYQLTNEATAACTKSSPNGQNPQSPTGLRPERRYQGSPSENRKRG